MKKYMFIIAVFLLLFMYSNLLADNVYVEIWNATGYEMSDCCIYINSTPVAQDETWQSGLNDYTFSVDNPSGAMDGSSTLVEKV